HGQGLTDNSWGPRALGDHGGPVSLPKLKKAYEKGTRGISWGPLLTPGPRAVPEFPNGQSTPEHGLLYTRKELPGFSFFHHLQCNPQPSMATLVYNLP
ncbi:unnamed protein product, partial [Staurois parvus]